MAQTWYYSRDGEEQGPVSAEQLRQLAKSGELAPDDYLWQEGMADWVPASRIKGLFPPQAAGSPPPREPQVKQAAPQVRPAQSAADRFAPDPEQPVVASDESVVKRLPSSSSGHFLDPLLNMARSTLDASLLRSSVTALAQVGGIGMLAAAGMYLTLRLMMAVRSGEFLGLAVGVSVAVLFLVLQYAASRLNSVLISLIRSTASRMSSTALLDSIALLFMTLGIFTLISLSVGAYQSGSWQLLGYAAGGFILLEYIAGLALHPSILNITVSAEPLSAGEEGLGVLSFFMKLVAWMVPVAFGIGVLVAIGMLGYAFYLHLEKDLRFNPALESGVSILSYTGLLPLLGYLYFIFYHLFLDVLRATLKIPDKLDVLAEIQRGK